MLRLWYSGQVTVWQPVYVLLCLEPFAPALHGIKCSDNALDHSNDIFRVRKPDTTLQATWLESLGSSVKCWWQMVLSFHF